MDIRNWPMDMILQLPDHFLSRRYSVFVALDLPEETTAWDISELALPDRAIIHEFGVLGNGFFGKDALVRLALGDQLPTAVGTMSGLEPLFAGLGFQGPEPRTFRVMTGAGLYLRRLRMFVPAQGRRLVLEAVTGAGITMSVMACVVVSSIPTEIPDCLLSM